MGASGRGGPHGRGGRRWREEGARERGFALLVVLWALVLVSLLVFRLTASGSAEARLGANLRAEAVAEADADGAFDEACIRLMARTNGWSLAGGTHELAVAGGHARVTVANEAGKVDLNNAAAGLLAALFQALGADANAAATVAQNVVAWRTPTAPGAGAALAAAPYRQAGLSYGPPGEDFQSTGELALVAGMTPDLMARVRPHVTVFGLGDPVLALADPVVHQAAAANGAVESAAQPSDFAEDTVVRLTVVVDAAGARFTRSGVVQLEPGVAPAPFRVLTWAQRDG